MDTQESRPAAGERPSCFADPNQVCPKDEDGIMQPQKRCLACAWMKPCLQNALRQQGLIADAHSEFQGAAKVKGFFKRWSDRKLAISTPPAAGKKSS
ncbi:MAG: hypothetical protein ACLGPL_09865 [Acidobacteriota bacterium]